MKTIYYCKDCGKEIWWGAVRCKSCNSKARVHDLNCSCYLCKAKRGETKGKNHPLFGSHLSQNQKDRLSEINSKYSTILTKEFLVKEYIDNKKSVYIIAKETDIDPKTIYEYLKKSEIKLIPREFNNLLRTSIQKHHIDLNNKNEEDTNLLFLTLSSHRKIHGQTYSYLVETGQIRKYIEWFVNKFNPELYSEEEWSEHLCKYYKENI